jgi:hypothetical protein
MKRSLRSNPASGHQGAYSDTGHSDHLAFNRAINTNNNRGYPQSGDEGDDHSDYPSPPRHFSGGHQLPDIPTSSHQRYNHGRDSEDGRNGADLELPLYTKMSSTGVQIGGEARRRAGGGGGLHSVMSQDMSGQVDSHYQTSYGESLAASNESEKHPLYDSTYAEDDDTGKAWGSKGYGAGPGRGGRRGLPPVTIRNPKNWKEWIVYHEEWVWTGVYTLLAMLTRYWKIGWADYVVWDEVCPWTDAKYSTLTNTDRSMVFRLISGNSAHTISTVISILTYIHRSGKCSSVSLGSCLATTAASSSNLVNIILIPCRIPPCE